MSVFVFLSGVGRDAGCAGKGKISKSGEERAQQPAGPGRGGGRGRQPWGRKVEKARSGGGASRAGGECVSVHADASSSPVSGRPLSERASGVGEGAEPGVFVTPASGKSVPVPPTSHGRGNFGEKRGEPAKCLGVPWNADCVLGGCCVLCFFLLPARAFGSSGTRWLCPGDPLRLQPRPQLRTLLARPPAAAEGALRFGGRRVALPSWTSACK